MTKANFITEGYVGLILAAGYGNRLKPYTDHIPKPLLPVCGTPVIKHAIFKLTQSGIQEIMINTHHLHDQIASFIKSNYVSNKNSELTCNTGDIKGLADIQVSYEPQILGTGGVYSKIKEWRKDRRLE